MVKHRLKLALSPSQGMFIVFVMGLQVCMSGCETHGESNLFDASSTGTCDLQDVDPDGNCTDTKANGIEEKMSGSAEVKIPNGSAAFDVGGECFAAGFDLATINWRLQNLATNNIVSQSGANVGTCSPLGRFRIRVDVPSGVNLTQGHKLSITMLGIDNETGRQVSNPTGLNTRTLTVLVE